MSLREEDLARFPTLAAIRTPRIARAIAAMLVFGILVVAAFLAFVPWVQTAYGEGRITTLDPADRVQNITALVPGRVEEWYVREGELVEAGDPIVRIVDTDPAIIDRLEAERSEAEAEIRAAEQAVRIARLDVERQRTLVAEGLAAPRDLEAAQLRVADLEARVAQSRAKLQGIDVRINRLSLQVVSAPRDGRVLQIRALDQATLVKEGDVLATFAPRQAQPVVELFVQGVDVPLVEAGRRVRLQFEGWPAVQFSGWPSIARGVFDGVVYATDDAASPNGLYRVLVLPAADRPPWPKEPAIRLGAQVRGWILMDTVTVGFELWRQLNRFPLQVTRSVSEGGLIPDGTTTAADGA
ncbi:HlyD family secretion protein [Thermaurantiacus tibetensis]|uniref:HlyD family secretion protein n=1 Tax=Thermaurantiacus tibetensis TaxID=2759035 RepID=UPI001F2EA5F0|nr:HlyD family efflux transporter periplasmic adaptor subunit [Thermaurantiacus tibetensis]